MALGHYTDQALLNLLQQGDEAAFAELYERFRPQVRRFALRITKSAQAADEIVQNVLLKLWNNKQKAGDIQNPGAWINRVSTNEALDFLKKIAREKALADKVWNNMQGQPAHYENDYVLKQYLEVVEAAVRSLPPQQQKIYRLSREQYLTYEQIAEELHLSANTVRNHMSAALDNIRKHLAEHALHSIPPAIAAILICGKI